MAAIHDLRQGPGGDPLSNGYYAVAPGGRVVLVPPLQKLKAGWRLATRAEVDGKPEPEWFKSAITFEDGVAPDQSGDIETVLDGDRD